MPRDADAAAPHHHEEARLAFRTTTVDGGPNAFFLGLALMVVAGTWMLMQPRIRSWLARQSQEWNAKEDESKRE